jgi:hypothetical protein
VKPSVRVPVPPLSIGAGWAASVLSGLLLVGLGPIPQASLPEGLLPATVTRYLAALLPKDARQIRLNNLYGSGHHGAWQFKAHLTWRDPAGAIHGGGTTLPLLASADPIDFDFDAGRLEREERIGWTLDEAAKLLRRIPDVRSRLAMIEMVPDPGHPAAVVTCAADDVNTDCQDWDRRGRLVRRYEGQLIDTPLDGPESVQRA